MLEKMTRGLYRRLKESSEDGQIVEDYIVVESL